MTFFRFNKYQKWKNVSQCKDSGSKSVVVGWGGLNGSHGSHDSPLARN